MNIFQIPALQGMLRNYTFLSRRSVQIFKIRRWSENSAL